MLNGNKQLYNEINKNKLFWHTVLNSLQANFFIALGRIFDEKRKTYSIIYFLKYCKENKGIFSKHELKKRKAKDLTEIKLKDYMEQIPTEPVTFNDFENLEKEINKYKNKFKKTYQPIRHGIFGHKSLDAIKKENELFANTQVGEIEDILNFLGRVYVAIVELYINGRKPDINDVEYKGLKKMITENTKNTLKSLLPKSK